METSYLLSKKDTALLVIDVQDKFGPVIPHFEGMIDNITRLVLTFQMFRMPVIVTEQYPKGLGPTVERLRNLFTLLEVIEKLELSATDNPRFWSQVNTLKATNFVVCGVETHVCVCQTVIKLIEKGMQVHVVADATGSRHPLDQNLSLRKMETAGARITTTEMCLFELAEKAGTETFKNIQLMVTGKPSSSVHAARRSVPDGPAAAAPGNTAGSEEETRAVDASKPAITREGETDTAAVETAVIGDIAERRPAPANDTGASSGAEAGSSSVQALLQTIEKEVGGAVKNTDKSETEIMNDMQEIDKLIGTIDNKDTDGKK